MPPPAINPLLYLVDLVLQLGVVVLGLYQLCIFIYIVLSWLFALDFLDRYKRIFKSKPHTWGSFEGFFRRLVEPLLIKIRAKMPRFGALDLSPIVLILVTYFMINLINYIRVTVIYGY